MLLRTHLAIGIAVGLYFLPFVNYEFIFVPIILISSLLPDADVFFPKFRRKEFSNSQKDTDPRGILHTYTFCVGVSIIIAFIYPIVALPFFMGYSFHLLADSFTKAGIRPFWPFKTRSTGVVKTGGIVEKLLFITFTIIDVVLAIMTLSRI
ncbi:hypothetical protein AUJ84_01845 [Candidatus Pacearchaeota archaeon CG1_02_32_132]|nr:MAG: hypothetical protein AUJ84_01845 [Candidatus Pacearchaeota archaeon CG1_02_32_132]